MKLIGNYTSPFVRKISIILLEKGIPFEFINEDPWITDSPVCRYNPLSKIPALTDDNGDSWYDSALIAGVLESLDVAPALLPADAHQALFVRQLEILADGVSDAALVIAREQMRPPRQQSEEVLLRQREKIRRGLDSLEAEVAREERINNGTLNVADIAIGCMIGYLNFRRIAPDWCVGHPALVKQIENLFRRESFAKTTPPSA